MQLRPGAQRATLRAGLALATASLLGTPAAAQEPEVETGVLVYSEPGRVSALEGVALISQAFRDDQRLSLRLVFDTLTGASPNGAAPSRLIQTFTRPSGRGSYQANPGETPLDDTFRDTRFAGSLTYDRPLFSSTRANFGFQGSTEHDYLSLGGSVGLVQDLNRKNTSLSAGLSVSRDEVRPEGGGPLPFSEMGTARGGYEDDRPASASGGDEDDDYPGEPGDRIHSGDTKWIIDGIAGLTQVIDRTTLVRFNYAVSASSGYLTDPYKLLSVVGAPGTPEAGDPLTYLYESRPSVRHKHSLFGELRKRLGSTTLGASYRYLWDTWGVVSHTGDIQYLFPVGGGYSLQPHFRVYQQSATDFHRLYLIDGEALPKHASADPRLGDMTALTAGAKLGGIRIAEQEFAVTLEYYHQFIGTGGADAFGGMEGLDLGEDMGAFMFRISHGWSP